MRTRRFKCNTLRRFFEEHDTILEMLERLENVAQVAASGEGISSQRLVDLQGFFSVFADKEVLFALAERLLTHEEQSNLAKNFAEVHDKKIDPEGPFASDPLEANEGEGRIG